jgi:hypothetical protein
MKADGENRLEGKRLRLYDTTISLDLTREILEEQKLTWMRNYTALTWKN